MRASLDAIAAANYAQGDTIDAVLGATDKARRLFTADRP